MALEIKTVKELVGLRLSLSANHDEPELSEEERKADEKCWVSLESLQEQLEKEAYKCKERSLQMQRNNR